MNELFQLYRKYRRSKEEPAELIAFIEAEGGEVLEHRAISRVVPAAFSALRILPMLYEFRVQYGCRQGWWYVRTTEDRFSTDWTWADDDGVESPVVDRPHEHAAAGAFSVGWLYDSLLVGGMIVIGVGGASAIYWKFF